MSDGMTEHRAKARAGIDINIIGHAEVIVGEGGGLKVKLSQLRYQLKLLERHLRLQITNQRLALLRFKL